MFSLPKQAKLLKTDEFSSVFNLRKRIAGPYLVMRFGINTLNRPRLGLVVSKKIAKSAVERNYMRRVLRELFRLNQHHLPPVDLIVQVQKKFEKPGFGVIQQEFQHLTRKISEKSVLSMPK